MTGRVLHLEVMEGPTGRKQRSQAEQARIAAESFRPVVSVSEVFPSSRRAETARFLVSAGQSTLGFAASSRTVYCFNDGQALRLIRDLALWGTCQTMILKTYLRARIKIDLPYSSKLQSVLVDRWLQNALQWNPRLQSDLLADHLSDRCATYLSRVLWVGRLVLELWRFPLFETAKLVNILPNLTKAGTVKCEIEQPVVQAIPVEAYENAYLLASELCAWCCNHDVDGDRVGDFHDLLEKLVKKNTPPFNFGGSSTIPVLRVAYQLGLPFSHLGRGVYQIGTGSRSRYIDRSHGEGDGFIGVSLSADKAISARILKQRGLPVPWHFSTLTRDAAIAAANTIGFPVVVKPVNANRGEGVTVGVDDNVVLEAAFDMARKRSRSGEVLIERQIPGVCHRLFIVKDRLLYAVKRLPLFVTGDGLRTVRQIIEDEIGKDRARPFWLRNKMARFDASAFAAMAVRGTDCDSVPAVSERILLRPIETTNWGGIDEDTTDMVHPLNLKAAVEAARAFGLEVAGVDMISTDISVPWMENGAVINEVNGGPLLGGGDVSRSHIATFLDIYLEGTGCISITEASANTGMAALLEQQSAYLGQGIRSWIVFHDAAIGPHGEEFRIDGRSPEAGVNPKGQALQYTSAPKEILIREVLQNRTVDHVVHVDDRAFEFPKNDVSTQRSQTP